MLEKIGGSSRFYTMEENKKKIRNVRKYSTSGVLMNALYLGLTQNQLK